MRARSRTLHPGPTTLALGTIVLVGTLVRGLVAHGHAGPVYFPDEYLYTELGRSLAESGHAYVRGNPSHFLPLLAPLVQAPAWLIDNVADAYRAVQWINAFAVSLAAVPAYALARAAGVRARLALVAAVFALLPPALLYSSFVLSEPIAYPLVLAAVATGVRALERPGVRTVGAFLLFAVLATFARLQFGLLLPCFLFALLVVLARDGRLRATLRAQWPAAALLVVATAVVAVVGPGRRTGYYGSFLDTGVGLGDLATAVARNAYVTLFESGFVLVPGAILGFVACVWRPRERSELVFGVLASTVLVALVLQASIYGDTYIAQTRYIFYGLPLLVVAFLLYAERGWPWRRVHAVLALALLATAFISPLGTLEQGRGKVHAPVLFAVARLEQLVGSGGNASAVVLLTAIAAMAVVVAATLHVRTATVVALAVAAGLSATAAAGAWSFDARNTHLLVKQFAGPRPSWIDALGVRSAPIVLAPKNRRTDVLEQMFWNRSLDRMVLLPNATATDVLPTLGATVRDDGTLVVDGRPLAGAALMNEYGTAIQMRGARRLGAGPTSTLYRADGPLRLRLVAIGSGADGWLENVGVVNVWPDATGRLAGRVVLRVTPPPGTGAITLRVRGRGDALTFRLRGGVPTRVVVPVCGTGPRSFGWEAPPAAIADGRAVVGRSTRPRYVPDPGACP